MNTLTNTDPEFMADHYGYRLIEIDGTVAHFDAELLIDDITGKLSALRSGSHAHVIIVVTSADGERRDFHGVFTHDFVRSASTNFGADLLVEVEDFFRRNIPLPINHFVVTIIA